MTAQIIEFAAYQPRLTSGSRVEQVLRRAREVSEQPARDVRAEYGLSIGDRVRHVTYGWDGVLVAFDWHGGVVATHGYVEVSFNGERARPRRLPLALLQKLYDGDAA